MVYEYANRMSKDDYEITMIDCKKIERKYRIIPKKLKYAVCKYYVCKTKKWYNLQHQVSLKCILGINDDTVPDGDVVVATAIGTKKLKEKYPNLQATLFGPSSRSKDIPKWIKYIHAANQQELNHIYNEAAIYMYPAIKEGFGLTGAEAMACGCAYVSSDYGGLHEYMISGRNVLLSAPKDVQGLS